MQKELHLSLVFVYNCVLLFSVGKPIRKLSFSYGYIKISFVVRISF